MIYLVYIEDGYFSEITECGRYALVVDNLTEARIFDDYDSAYKIVEHWGGEIRSFEC